MCRIVVVLLIVGLFVNTAAALPGSGTQEDPWRIQSLVNFDEFANNPDYWDDYTRLETDVNLAGRTYTTAVIAPDIECSSGLFGGTAFIGSFDGNGHKLINLTIDDGGAGNYYLGLFGYIEDGEVRNVGLEGGSVSGYICVGGLVGCNLDGSVSNCYSTGDVSGGCDVGGLVGSSSGSVSNCYSTGSVSSIGPVGDDEDEQNFGGLVGYNTGIVSNCYSACDVTGGDWVGGLVGYNRFGSILNCCSIGSVSGDQDVGGLVGVHIDGSISNSHSTCEVKGISPVGGLVGYNDGDVSNCYSTGDVDGTGNVGGLVGNNYGGSVSNCFWDTDTQTHGVTESIGENLGTAINVAGLPTTLMQTKSTFTEAGWDFTTPIWTIEEGVDYPKLWWERPVLHAEPEVTVWTSNRISWEPVVGEVEYYAECAEDANFTSVIYSTGWITETSYEFTGLMLGQRYWYRVKARNPAGVESQWSNVESSLQGTLAEAVEIVLESINLKSENLKEPYINKINTAQEMIDSGNFTSALNKLENDILQKTDGCAEMGQPDKSDWIITCEEQSQIYSLIIETIEHVNSLMQ